MNVFPINTDMNINGSKKDKAKTGVKSDSSDQEPEGLTLLVPDIQRTAEIVYAATTSLRQANHERKLAEFSKKASVKPKPLSVLRSLEEKYVVVMKKLQFEIKIVEQDCGMCNKGDSSETIQSEYPGSIHSSSAPVIKLYSSKNVATHFGYEVGVLQLFGIFLQWHKGNI
ncbi:UNVERIFIED_CONTAM: Baculoviral IAP repeat-containing protein 6 [Gekko kuhli]